MSSDEYEKYELNPDFDIPVNAEEIDVEWLRQSNLFLE